MGGIIILASINSSDGIDYSEHLRILGENLTYILIRMPALKDKADDIPRLATFYINGFNIEMGRQIVGFEKNALEALQKFYWPGNMDQFKRILNQLMTITNGPYITYENTMYALHQETPVKVGENEEKEFSIDINKKLHEINRDIVNIVLRNNNGNHSATAAKLGISRATLWRMLKK